MKILLSGSTGLIGSELIDFLIYPVIKEIGKWNPPDIKEINDFFVFYGMETCLR